MGDAWWAAVYIQAVYCLINQWILIKLIKLLYYDIINNYHFDVLHLFDFMRVLLLYFDVLHLIPEHKLVYFKFINIKSRKKTVIEIHILHSLRSCKMEFLSLVWDKQSQNMPC
jgi:hypothetical protein